MLGFTVCNCNYCNLTPSILRKTTQNAQQLEQKVEALQKTQHAISQQVRDLQAEKAALESRNKELKQRTDHVTAENERLNNQVQYVLRQKRERIRVHCLICHVSLMKFFLLESCIRSEIFKGK